MFLNYPGLTISTSRNNGVSCGDDIIDFCHEVQRDRACTFTFNDCPEFYMDVLCDGSLLDGLDKEVVEAVYQALSEIEEVKTSKTFEQAEKFYNENKDRLLAEFLSEVTGKDLDYQTEYDQVIIAGLCCQCSDMNGDGFGKAHYDNAGADDGFIDLVKMIASDDRSSQLVAKDEFWDDEYVRMFAHDLARAIIDEFGVESYFECNRVNV